MDASRMPMSSLYATSNRPTIHPGGAGKSDSAIAKHVGVDVKTVGAWRGKLTMEIPKSTMRPGSDGRTINTANIRRLVFHAAFPCRNLAGFVRGVSEMCMSEYFHHHAD